MCSTLAKGMNSMMKKRLIVIVFGTVLLIAVAVVVALRERQPVSKPEASVAQTPAGTERD